MSNAEKIRVHLADGMAAKDIAKKVKCSLAYVYAVKAKWMLTDAEEERPYDWTVSIDPETLKPSIDQPPVEDVVNSPPHYTQGEVECIDAIRSMLTAEEFRGYCKGNSVAYIWRMNQKGSPEVDADKSNWYLAWLRGQDPREL